MATTPPPLSVVRTDSLAIYPPGVFLFFRPWSALRCGRRWKQGGETPPPGISRDLRGLLVLFCTGLEILEKRIASDPPAEAGEEKQRAILAKALVFATVLTAFASDPAPENG